MIKPGLFGKVVAADNRRMDFDFGNEQLLYLNKEIDFLFIGDSITQLWDLNAYFDTEKFLVNRGIGGDTSEYVLKRFDADVIQLKPKKVVLMIGTNDISQIHGDVWWRVDGQEPSVVLENIKSNFHKIIEKCKANTIDLVLCSIIPSDIAPPFPKLLRQEMTIELNEFIKELAENNNYKYINYYDSLCGKDGKTLIYELSQDGIHPNAKAYFIMAEILKKELLI
jgi:lysophospholipase L1-like esterase